MTSSVAVGVALAGWALGSWEAVPFQLATIAIMVCTWRVRVQPSCPRWHGPSGS